MEKLQHRKNIEGLDSTILSDAEGLDWFALLLYGVYLMFIGLILSDNGIISLAMRFYIAYFVFLCVMLYVRIRQKRKSIVKAYFFAIICVLITILLSWNLQSLPNIAEWKFIFDEKKKTFLDIEACDTLHVPFGYHNNTNKQQIIDSVKTSCGCTNVIYDKEPIAPGESGELMVHIDLTDESGAFSQSVIVYFNKQTPVVLKINGRIRHPVDSVCSN